MSLRNKLLMGGQVSSVRKHLVTDEHLRPIAVQIDYADWLKIEQSIADNCAPSEPRDLSRYSGVLDLKDDALVYQRHIRSEWL